MLLYSAERTRLLIAALGRVLGPDDEEIPESIEGAEGAEGIENQDNSNETEGPNTTEDTASEEQFGIKIDNELDSCSLLKRVTN